ncbi:CBS domain-containing protein [Lentzea sp. NPDC006480]|uniref:CBS domain-containing protein n=1 Tax=Lentzea sp. NPDC006480 TaxID=3157176 RepID=UPI0033B2232C
MDKMAAAWLVRGGKDGEREDEALEQGLIIAGWPDLGDLSGYADRNQLRSAVRATYPEYKTAVTGNWTGQLWRLLREIKEGDLVVMPLKSTQMIAIGRVTGPYHYRADHPAGFRHTRPVEWLRTSVSRRDVQQDLLHSMGSLLTICGLRRFGAARRVAHLAEFGVDPGPFAEEVADTSVPAEAQRLFEEASAAEVPLRIAIRDLLTRWGVSRRTPDVVARIELALDENGLVAKPSIADEWVGTEVELISVVDEHRAVETDAANTEPDAPDDSVLRMITLQVGRLTAANAGVAAVRPDDLLARAQTIMLSQNFSQLAVIEENGEFCGAISWESIGKAHLGEPAAEVCHATVPARVVEHNEDLLNQLAEIYASGYVFVRGADRKISGIVTAADLTAQFGDVARPFVLLEEIERRMHRIASEKFTIEEIAQMARYPNKVRAGDNPMLGDYERLLEDPAMWARVGWRLDQSEFVSLFKKVRLVRNGLMHFSSDALAEQDLEPVHGLLRTLRVVDPRA